MPNRFAPAVAEMPTLSLMRDGVRPGDFVVGLDLGWRW